MKYLLLLVVIGVVVWMMSSRRRRDEPDAPPAAPRAQSARKKKADAAPTPMLACSHCGVHLPQAEVVTDASGQAYCSEAHRLAGPR